MNGSEPRLSVFRIAIYAIGIVVAVSLVVRHLHHRHSPDAASLESSPVQAPEAPSRPSVSGHRGTAQVIADCAPHLREGSTLVPNIEVTDRYNMAAIGLKVRFWVNGDGFVTRAFVSGFTVASAADQEAELDFVQHLTFTVVNTEECRSRSLEMVANFSESRVSGGEWATVLEVHPLVASDGDKIVRRP